MGIIRRTTAVDKKSVMLIVSLFLCHDLNYGDGETETPVSSVF